MDDYIVWSEAGLYYTGLVDMDGLNRWWADVALARIGQDRMRRIHAGFSYSLSLSLSSSFSPVPFLWFGSVTTFIISPFTCTIDRLGWDGRLMVAVDDGYPLSSHFLVLLPYCTGMGGVGG